MESAKLFGLEPRDMSKVNLILGVIIAALGILLMILTLSYGFTDCDKLRFEWEGKSLDAGQFMEVYSSKCLNKGQSFLNTSLNLSSNLD